MDKLLYVVQLGLTSERVGCQAAKFFRLARVTLNKFVLDANISDQCWGK